jgi:nicotinamidase-related amidase
MVDVCIFVDPLYDFLDIGGQYCQIFGIGETTNVRDCKSHIDSLFVHCRSHSVKVVLVTSEYIPNQFEGVPSLCTTPVGKQFMIQGLNNSNIDDDIMVVTKSKNSVLHCDKAVQLLDLIRDKHVLICGVTTTSCIQCCVNDLKDCCASLSIGLNSVGSRLSKADERALLIERFNNDTQVRLYDTWEEALQLV